MGNKKKTILPIILMVDDGSSEGFEQFVLAIKKLGKEDISDMEDGKARFEAGLLINPIDYLPGLRRSKTNTLTTDLLADEVKGLREQLKHYEHFLRKQKNRKVDVHTLLKYISSKQ